MRAPPAAPAPASGPLPAAPFADVQPEPAPLPSWAEAEALLIAAAAGRLAGDEPASAAAIRVVATASAPELAALTGGAAAVDTGLLRTGAALRLRLELALSVLSATGAAGGAAAAQRLLVEVDELLAKLKAVSDAGPEAAAALDPMRHAVVDGGVRLAGALSRLVPERPAADAAIKPAEKPGTRLLSNDTVQRAATPASRKALWAVFAVILAATAGYHVWRRAGPAPLPPQTLPGAPANTYVVQQGPIRLLKASAGATVSPAELEQFKAQEQAKGNVVRELGSGVWAVEPEHAGGKKP